MLKKRPQDFLKLSQARRLYLVRFLPFSESNCKERTIRQREFRIRCWYIPLCCSFSNRTNVLRIGSYCEMLRMLLNRPSLSWPVILAVCYLAAVSPVFADIDPMDWPNWRGPHQNGVSDEVGLIDRFDLKSTAESNLIWKSDDAAGISTPIVMNGRLFTIVRDQPDTPKDAEKIVCLDAVTGTTIASNRQ